VKLQNLSLDGPLGHYNGKHAVIVAFLVGGKIKVLSATKNRQVHINRKKSPF
jgi:hypothetical protein